MKAAGFVLLAILAAAFLHGVAMAPAKPGARPARAAAALGPEWEAARRYVVDTPGQLAEAEAERLRTADRLRALCREGYVERGYCRALDNP